MPDLLTLVEVSRRYGDLVAVDAVSLSLAVGECRALVGANGAGKSTLLDLVAGTVRPHAGRVLLDGRDVTRLGPVRRARLGVARTHQRPAVWPGLGALDNIILGGWPHARRLTTADWRRSDKLRGLCSPAAYRRHLLQPSLRVLDSVGLGALVGVPAGELSHGQRRLLEIGVALAGRPRLLLLDEPTAGLWPAEVSQLADLLGRLPPQTSMLLAEHHLEFAYALADGVTVLCEGAVA
jgi:branched-chain amino acid transport system ATP-binding protein